MKSASSSKRSADFSTRKNFAPQHWVRSHEDDATIVLDRHNLIFRNGPLDLFENELSDAGLARATPKEIPAPHVHNYHGEWDDAERAILKALDWTVKALREQDIQYQER